MLTITGPQMEALNVAHEEGYRRRAFDHARQCGAVHPQSTDEQLRPAFGFVEQVAAQNGIEAEQSRLALFMLALMEGPSKFHHAAVLETLGDRNSGERVRVRQVIDLFERLG